MTLTRGLVVASLMLAATVVLMSAPPWGPLVWLGIVAGAVAVPNWSWRVATTFQPKAAWRWTVTAWAWLDRR